MSKRDILQTSSFGERIAEEETEELSAYFVETDQWLRLFNGSVDIVYGPKGAGKSAIYSLLLNRSGQLAQRRILVRAAEKPRGAPVFKDLSTVPAPSEVQFIALWKVYFLSLIADTLRTNGIQSATAQRVITPLEEAGLLERGASLSNLLKAGLEFVGRFFNASGYEATVTVDPNTGAHTYGGKISLREPSAQQRAMGVQSVDELIEVANNALREANYSLWIVIDRLDVSFADSPELERNALRSLFKVYLDILEFRSISLKIFLRNDIWSRISEGGFREASHITRTTDIEWEPQSLLNLILRRILKNESIVGYYNVSKELVLSDTNSQEGLFYRIFPKEVETGKSKTLDYIVGRTRDGKGETAPREVIHFLSSLRETQLKKLELGGTEPQGEQLFERAAFKDALPAVSKGRLEQTLYAEFPNLKPYLQQLEGAKTEQTVETLAVLWSVAIDEAASLTNQLVDIGFFQKKSVRGNTTYWVPFLYRPALRLVQGTASGIEGWSDEEE